MTVSFLDVFLAAAIAIFCIVVCLFVVMEASEEKLSIVGLSPEGIEASPTPMTVVVHVEEGRENLCRWGPGSDGLIPGNGICQLIMASPSPGLRLDFEGPKIQKIVAFVAGTDTTIFPKNLQRGFTLHTAPFSVDLKP